MARKGGRILLPGEGGGLGTPKTPSPMKTIQAAGASDTPVATRGGVEAAWG